MRGSALIRLEENTGCQQQAHEVGTEALQAPHGFYPYLLSFCSRSGLPMTPHGLPMAAALQLKAAPPQLSVPQSAKAASALLTSPSSNRQAAQPYEPGGQRDQERERKNRRKGRSRKNGTGRGAKDEKTI